MSQNPLLESQNVRTDIRFILNGADAVLRDVHPTDTLLDHIRLQARLTGTKEGCAEGDCGACTVLVGRLVRGTLRYEPVNACICLMPMIDGTHVVTVEHLSNRADLHPVQQAMVEHHGSQCGFCTPGIVMSLYALWMANPAPDAAHVKTALQGNLCRCTGYAPIIKAGLAMGPAASDPLSDERASIIARLSAMQDGARVELGAAIVPGSAADLADALATHPAATIVAGATDVGLWVTKSLARISPAIFIGGISDLQEIHVQGNAITVGAGVTYARFLDFITDQIPQMGDYLRRIGGAQIRAQGTIGGNIANGSPIGDMAPALIPLGAELVLRSAAGPRVVALENFFVAYGQQDLRPGEFVEAITFPKPPPGALYALHKVSKRRDEDISTVAAGFLIEVSDGVVTQARLAYGGMAGIPMRAAKAEMAMAGQAWSENAVSAAMAAMADDFSPLSDARASADYRKTVAQNLLLRTYLEATQ